jgi:hypothetical protein
MKALSLFALFCLAACGTTSTAPSLPGASADAPSAAAAKPTAGFYVAHTGSYDDALPAAAIGIQVGPNGKCASFADISLTAKSPTKQRVYGEPLRVTTFAQQPDNGIVVAATSNLGGALGKLRLSGAIANGAFTMVYADALGKGTATAYYAGPCATLQTAGPPPGTFVGPWVLHVGQNTGGGYVAPTNASITITSASADPYEKNVINLRATLNSPISYASKPPYALKGAYYGSTLSFWFTTDEGGWSIDLPGFNVPPSSANGGYSISAKGPPGFASGPISISK